MKTMINGTLEICHDTGVIYFHDLEGRTILRVGQLRKPIPSVLTNIGGPKISLLDIAAQHCNWPGQVHRI